jgi:hypothetical protein
MMVMRWIRCIARGFAALFFSTLPARLILLAAVVMSVWFIVYPAPSFYYWDVVVWRPYTAEMKRVRVLQATTPARRAALDDELSRRFFTDYEPYGDVRADTRLMLIDLGFTWLIAFGLVLVVKPVNRRRSGS